MGKLEKRFPIYSRLINLYPDTYKDLYGQEMLQTLASMLDAPQAHKLTIWLRAIVDLPISLTKQQLSYLGGDSPNHAPSYMAKSSKFGALLITPFFIILVLNSLTNHGLYHTFLWRVGFLFTWLILLPSVAIIINIIAFARWSIERRQDNKKSFLYSLFDFRHNWPMLYVAILGLGILAMVIGHDSVHCVSGNPVREASNWHQIWQCIQQKTPPQKT